MSTRAGAAIMIAVRFGVSVRVAVRLSLGQRAGAGHWGSED